MDQNEKATGASRSADEASADKASSSGSRRKAADTDAPAEDQEPGTEAGRSGKEKEAGRKGQRRPPNNLRRIREDLLMAKAELARRANLSVLTIDRVEKGFGCRMATKRKILEALGLSLADRARVFGEEE